MTGRRLTRKQSVFVAKYVETGNATEAAFAAYDTSRDVARSIGSENLTKPDIRRAIDEALKAFCFYVHKSLSVHSSTQKWSRSRAVFMALREYCRQLSRVQYVDIRVSE